MKKCSKCGEEKALSEFYKHPGTPDGRHTKCKQCYLDDVRNYHRSPRGVATMVYRSQRRASEQRGHPQPSYSKKEFSEWLFSKDVFWDLYYDWLVSGCDKWMKPSCDRVNSLLPYTFDNLQVVTWRENCDNGHRDMANGIFGNTIPVVQKDLNGNEVGRYFSVMEAERQTGTNHEHICEIIGGKCYDKQRKTANGFIWEKAE